MTADDFFEFVRDRLRIFANRHCEIRKCQRCGREYPSRGIRDCGICPECLQDNVFIGGVYDNTRS